MMSHSTFPRTRWSSLFLALGVVLTVATGRSEEHPAAAPHKDHETMKKTGDAPAASAPAKPAPSHNSVYPLDSCIVSGEKLAAGEAVVKEYDGREVRFCCKGCVKKFEQDKETYIKKIDDAIVAAQKGVYPIDACVVSGEKLGGDDEKPVDFVYRNRLVRLCCNGCKKDFVNDPDKYLAKLDQAVVEKQLKDYPLDVCVVSGEKLGGEMGEPVNYVHNGNLVRFCCKSCVKPFDKDPAKYTAKIRPAAKDATATAKPTEAAPSAKDSHAKDAPAGSRAN